MEKITIGRYSYIGVPECELLGCKKKKSYNPSALGL
jgi:hypothetical protein